MAKYKVTVIRDKCIGAASCVAIAPKAFKLDEEQKAIILDSVSEESDDNLLLAAQSCPTAAIIVTDTETGEQIWPK
jgi:ferredoxin